MGLGTSRCMLGIGQKEYEQNIKDAKLMKAVATNRFATLFVKNPNIANTCLNALDKMTWENLQAMYQRAGPDMFCLLHGDFHPKQLLWHDD